ncbi:hypothetical protein DL95DRAFT_440055 [Leptodontidium sp. 2 PMI_412]|nr:hypothetical protein DL95DRAFT_440055 [Leptodontidium sp. 2 PMI_412]
MRFSTNFFTLASAATLAFGSPLTTRDEPSVLLCTDKNFTGHCVNLRAPSGVCVTFTDDLNDKVSSLRPAPGNTCLHFVAPDCSPDDVWFYWGEPSLPDLSVTPTHGPIGSTHNYDDQLSSLKCWTDP